MHYMYLAFYPTLSTSIVFACIVKMFIEGQEIATLLVFNDKWPSVF